MSEQSVPVEMSVDVGRGGRWTSLRSRRDNGTWREWLWRNPDPAIVRAREHVDSTSAFVDAGGGEECYPCLRSPWDHGLIWNRPWHGTEHDAQVEAEGYRLSRRTQADAGTIVADYCAGADTVRPVTHTTHLLLDLSPDARLCPGAHGDVVFFDAPPLNEISDLGGTAAFVESIGDGRRGAVCYLLPGCTTVTLVDGPDRLRLDLIGVDLPLGFVVWRNLCAWPEEAPYRSIGIEPSLGGAATLSPPGPHTALVGPGMAARWRLVISASSLVGADQQP